MTGGLKQPAASFIIESWCALPPFSSMSLDKKAGLNDSFPRPILFRLRLPRV